MKSLSPAPATGFIGRRCGSYRLAWLAANGIPGLAAAVTQHGNVLALLELAPCCPVRLHCGTRAEKSPVTGIAAAMALHHPGIEVHVYANSGRGFNNDGAPQTDPQDTSLARSRTLALFNEQIGLQR